MQSRGLRNPKVSIYSEAVVPVLFEWILEIPTWPRRALLHSHRGRQVQTAQFSV